MNAGKQWPSELREYKDPVSGARVRQLTSYLGHSNHFYFTYPCWYDDGRKVVIASDRENRTNFFGVDLASGELTQLTDLDPAAGTVDAQSMTKNPCRDVVRITVVYQWINLSLVALRRQTAMPVRETRSTAPMRFATVSSSG